MATESARWSARAKGEWKATESGLVQALHLGRGKGTKSVHQMVEGWTSDSKKRLPKPHPPPQILAVAYTLIVFAALRIGGSFAVKTVIPVPRCRIRLLVHVSDIASNGASR